MDKIKIGVVTTSDRASQGIYEDISGVAIMETMQAYLKNECEYLYRCIPDEQTLIEK
ncbi:MAG: molybdopterin adenylyltransferase, partial [Pseudomonadota bacterium]